MANTRFFYDQIRNEKRNQETTDGCIYYLNTPGNGLNIPFIEDPNIRLQKWGANLQQNNITIENQLYGIDKKYHKYGMFHDSRDIDGLNNLGKNINYPKSKIVFSDTSRITHPVWTFRDIDRKERFLHFPLIDPQENIWFKFDNNLNTRILEKNKYSMKNNKIIK